MSVRHYTHEELRVHLVTPDPAITDHVESCDECREAVAFMAEFEAALADPMVWEAAEALQQPSGVRSEHLKAARLLEEEDRQATQLLTPALVSIGAFREHEVDVRGRYRSAAAVRVLAREAKRVRDSSPKFASLLAKTALTIAGKLTSPVRAVVLGSAWLELGIAVAMLGQYRESEDALRHAEEAFEVGGNRWDLATVWLSRANVFSETERFEEALDLSARAADVFLADYGDMGRYLRASLVRGTVLYFRRQYAESISIFESMLPAAASIHDPLTEARALHNAANSYAGAGQIEIATEYYTRALALWDQLGSDAEQARTRWALAAIDVARGQWELGYEGLEHARRELAALGLATDEALVRLEMAEALILLDRSREVPDLLAGIAVQFASEGMMRNAKLALAWLAEGNRRTPTREELRHVRDYLARLPTRPSERFLPMKHELT